MSAPRLGLLLAIAGFCVAGSAFAAGADTKLIDAVKTDNAAVVKTLLSKGADVNAAEADGSTALHWAVQHGNIPITGLLLAAGAKVSAATRYNITPLSIAAMNGDAGMINRLLEAGADPNSTSREGETVLMTASINGNVDAIKALLAKGAKVNTVEPWKGQNALMWASGEGNAKAAEMLIEFGAEVGAKSKDGFTALLFAVRNNQIEAARTLLDHGANVNDVAPDGTSALNVACVNAYYDLASLLLDYKADPNLPDPRGSPLITIVFLDKPGSTFEAAGNAEQAVTAPRPTGKVTAMEIIQKLLDHGANPNARYSTKEGRLQRTFFSANNPRNIPLGRHFLSYFGATAYYVAARNGDAPLMRLHIKGGADPKINTAAGVTPLMAAAGLDYYEGESPGPFTGDTEAERLEAVKLAYELGGDINAQTHFGDYPMIARDKDDFSLTMYPANVDDLLNTGVGDPRFDGCTALMGAVISNQPSILQFLLDKGADINVTTRFGWTAQRIAHAIILGNTKQEFPAAAAMLKKAAATRSVAQVKPATSEARR
jgi:ankyrin repeat protein